MADDKPDDKPGLLTLAWFAPLYRRVILIAAIVLWVGWEWLFNHDQFWQIISVVMLVYGVWTFFVTFDKTLKQVNDAKSKN